MTQIFGSFGFSASNSANTFILYLCYAKECLSIALFTSIRCAIYSEN